MVEKINKNIWGSARNGLFNTMLMRYDFPMLFPATSCLLTCLLSRSQVKKRIKIYFEEKDYLKSVKPEESLHCLYKTITYKTKFTIISYF